MGCSRLLDIALSPIATKNDSDSAIGALVLALTDAETVLSGPTRSPIHGTATPTTTRKAVSPDEPTVGDLACRFLG